MFSLGGKRVYVAGDRGMVGAALVRRLMREDCQVITRCLAHASLAQLGKLVD
mgnify:CR=1 FL=1